MLDYCAVLCRHALKTADVYSKTVKLTMRAAAGRAVLMWTCCVCVVAPLVHTMSDGKPVAGVTSLGEEIYLLRGKRVDAVEVYDVISYRLLRCLTVPNSRGFTDMTSCANLLCLYISDWSVECIHRLDLHGNAEQWPVSDKPYCLSVNTNHNLIVTCREVGKIKEFSPRGELLRDVILPNDVTHPYHAIQLTSGQFIVCHGSTIRNDRVHRVCKISSDGRHVVQSHGGHRGSDTGQYDGPLHLAVDDNEFVFVVDFDNRRVTLLSPTLEYVRQVVSRDQLKWLPYRLCLDVQRRRLYLADYKWDDDKPELTAGRVVVFSV